MLPDPIKLIASSVNKSWATSIWFYKIS